MVLNLIGLITLYILFLKTFDEDVKTSIMIQNFNRIINNRIEFQGWTNIVYIVSSLKVHFQFEGGDKNSLGDFMDGQNLDFKGTVNGFMFCAYKIHGSHQCQCI